MNLVVLRGLVVGAPVERTLPSGSHLVQFDVRTNVDGRHVTVPVAWFDPPADVMAAAGAEVVVSGLVRRRFFRVGSLTQSRTEVVAEAVAASTNRRAVTRLVSGAVRALGG